MSEVGLPAYPLRPTAKPVLISMGISLVVHGLLFGLVVVLGVAAAAFKDSNQKVLERLAEMQRAQPKPDDPARHEAEIPLLFIEVDPTTATPEAPPNAKYYSDKSTKAANPDANVDTGVPKITGVQTHVPKTETVPLTRPTPMQTVVPPPAPPAPPAQLQPESPPKSAPKPGDLAMAKPDLKPLELPKPTEPAKAAEPTHERPRTLAAVQPPTIGGDLMKSDGGVTRQRLSPSFDTVGTPFGAYDAAVIAAIKARWFDLLEDRNFLRDRTGKVVLSFRLNYDGSITNMKVEENTVGDILKYICERAITDNANYAKWSNAMRQWFGADYRDVTFTFFYD